MSCACVSCSMCSGQGHVWLDLRGRVVAHLDDLDEMEICEDCGGTGVSETCEECIADDRDDSFDLFLGGM